MYLEVPAPKPSELTYIGVGGGNGVTVITDGQKFVCRSPKVTYVAVRFKNKAPPAAVYVITKRQSWTIIPQLVDGGRKLRFPAEKGVYTCELVTITSRTETLTVKGGVVKLRLGPDEEAYLTGGLGKGAFVHVYWANGKPYAEYRTGRCRYGYYATFRRELKVEGGYVVVPVRDMTIHPPTSKGRDTCPFSWADGTVKAYILTVEREPAGTVTLGQPTVSKKAGAAVLGLFGLLALIKMVS